MFVISPVLNAFDVLFKKPHNISRLQQMHNNSCRGLEAWDGRVQAQQGISVPAWGLHAQHNISSLLKLWPCKTGAVFQQVLFLTKRSKQKKAQLFNCLTQWVFPAAVTGHRSCAWGHLFPTGSLGVGSLFLVGRDTNCVRRTWGQECVPACAA